MLSDKSSDSDRLVVAHREMDGEVRKGRLIVVSGPSGVGKSTLIEEFLKQDGQSGFSVSYTTRQKRRQEVNGREYHFVDRQKFDEMVGGDRFLEWESVHGNMYGTPKQEILNTLHGGKDIILDIDVKGALNVKKQCSNACLIFIEPPSAEDLVRRLTFRGEKDIELRMKRVKEEIAQKASFEYTIMNDDLKRAYDTFKDTIRIIRSKGNGKNNC
ncbi:MAG TPA: guanylate kinase [Syntrophorhabdaceae bacterium]|nr:guanylate kinase [Syntrophorhabdaceae bacterium]